MDPITGAQMVPMLPCVDIDATADFWTAAGLTITYRQVRPNPYVALERGGIALHYYGLDGLLPEANHGTCGIVVADTEPLYRLIVAGLEARYGRVPVAGLPRITRPRRRANNAGLSGFSIVDPDANWIRVSRRPAGTEAVPRAVDDRVEWVSQGGGRLARALESAVVTADSHGDDVQAERVLTGALQRDQEAPLADRAAAWAFLAELRVRLGDTAGAARAREGLATLAGSTAQERAELARARREVDELLRQ